LSTSSATTAATPNFDAYDRVRAVSYVHPILELLDQRVLPHQIDYVRCETVAEVIEAIFNLTVRGAPAIGIAAAFGVVMSARAHAALPETERAAAIKADCVALNAARPTAVNLAWALARMQRRMQQDGSSVAVMIAEAETIQREDLEANRAMGVFGAELIAPDSGVLTHCNTGSLATAGFGTALGVIRAGVAMRKITRVFASETRPWLQGARLTAWELLQDGIDAKLIADGAGAHIMQKGLVQWLIVGADRICANGDTANKIGTLAHACAAKQFGVKVMVVAPSSTFDPQTASGDLIHIEERDPKELLEYAKQRVAAPGVQAFNPVFDVTPKSLIDAVVSERGVWYPNR
jgi:methylthioribose-1-phosphate isomerase